jgi:hypothetical protein
MYLSKIDLLLKLSINLKIIETEIQIKMSQEINQHNH